MSKRPLSWHILVFTLLEFVVRTQLTAYDNSHGYISSNHDRYLASEISSMQEELASDIRSAAMDKLNLKLQLKFDPEFLDFKQRPLGVPHLEKVTLFNVDGNQSIDMTSISGNTVHFHSSFFEDKKIPPLGNTSFNVVFLGREEGAVESNLFIHTTEGHFKYHVKGASVYSPYRLRPIVGVRLPLNTTFTPLIHLHNPYLVPIQIEEIYSSGGEFHLELPSGELEGPKDMWEIRPLETKAVIKVRFQARAEQNHTAYIRIKLNNTDDILVVPLEVEVTSDAVLYAPDGYVDFGVGGSLDADRELPLRLSNPFKKPMKIQSITSASKAVRIEYGRRSGATTAKENGDGSVDVATLRLNWKTAFEERDFSGKIVIKYRNGKARTEVPYYITVIEGGLTYNASTTEYFVGEGGSSFADRKMTVRNDFPTPIMLINVSLPLEAQKFFHISDFARTVLKHKEERVIFRLQVNEGLEPADLNVNTHIELNTNISSFSIPLVSYDGKFELRLPYKSKDNSLDLGLVSLESRKDTYVLLVNRNPVAISVEQLATSLPSSTVEIVGCGHGDVEHALLQDTYKNMSKCAQVQAGEYAVLRLSIKSGRSEAQIWGDISLSTRYEQLSIPVHFKVAHGKLEIGPDRLVFDQCFPGKICSHPLRVHSTFNEPMVIEDILSIPPDPRINSKHSGHIMARTTKIIGHLYLDPNVDCQNECYLGVQDENKANWWKTLSLSKATTEFDLNLVNILYNRYLNQTSNGLTKWQNLTMRLDTSEVKGHLFKTRVKMSWPSLLVDQSFENKSTYAFPLTQVGNVTYCNVTVKNPSSHPLLVQVVMDRAYPGFDVLFEGLPPVFIPNSGEPLRKLRHGFFLEHPPTSDPENFPGMHESSIGVRLKANDNFTFQIGFRATDAVTNTAFVFLRNNLTVLEVLHLSGKGAYPSFKFGNRKPGSSQPLAFELTEKHLKDCEWERTKKHTPPALTVKRSFTARNTGDVPVYINGFYINSLPCEGYGFKVLNCDPVALPPNGTKKIDIAFTPDFTLAKITRTLVLDTSLNHLVNYTLVTTVPSYYLSLCSNVIARPRWEYHMYYICVISMLLLLFFVILLPLMESQRIVKDAVTMIPRQNSAQQHALDLRLIGAQTRSEIHSGAKNNDSDAPQKKTDLELQTNSSKQDEGGKKPEGEKYTAVVPTTGKASKKKSAKKVMDMTEQENRKRNWLETQKLKQEEQRAQHGDHEKRKKTTQSKASKVESKQVEAPTYEEETSSTTTESSNNEEMEKNSKFKTKAKDKKTDGKRQPQTDETEGMHVKLQRRKSDPKNGKLKEVKAQEKAEPHKVLSSEAKAKKKDRKERNAKKLSVDKTPKSDSSNNVSPSTIRTSPSFQTNTGVWGENRATFSDVVARNDPVTQIQKPTMYVEPYKQPTTAIVAGGNELGPIGSRKLDLWQNDSLRGTTGAQPPQPRGEEYNSFFAEAHNLAVESTNAFLDFGPGDGWSSSTSIVGYIQGSNGCTSNAQTVHDPWLTPRAQTSSTWDAIGDYISPPVNATSAAPATTTAVNDLRTSSPPASPHSGYLWGSSSVWQPWTPAELPTTPTRTPPGFAPHHEEEEMHRRQQQQQQQSHATFNPFGISNIWTQYQHPNPWNYPQGQ